MIDLISTKNLPSMSMGYYPLQMELRSPSELMGDVKKALELKDPKKVYDLSVRLTKIWAKNSA